MITQSTMVAVYPDRPVKASLPRPPGPGTMFHSLRLRMSNVPLAMSRGTVQLDTGSPGDKVRTLDQIASLGLPQPDTILLTHAHAHHPGGAAAKGRHAPVPRPGRLAHGASRLHVAQDGPHAGGDIKGLSLP